MSDTPASQNDSLNPYEGYHDTPYNDGSDHPKREVKSVRQWVGELLLLGGAVLVVSGITGVAGGLATHGARKYFGHKEAPSLISPNTTRKKAVE